MDKVVLVDTEDNSLGTMEKMEAHEKGLLHRAFSVFVFNDAGELLLQRRALSKYHSGGLWTNTCCSHPRIDETPIIAGKRRLIEEMGFTAELEDTFSFIYEAKLDNDLTEHELDHVLIGHYNDAPVPNKLEVDSWRYSPMSEIELDMEKHPENYTIWFKIIFDQVKNYKKS